VERGAKPVSNVITREASTHIEAKYEDPHYGNYAQIKWKCSLGTPLLDLILKPKREAERRKREEERKQLMTPEGRMEAETKYREEVRKRGEERRIHVEQVTKLARGDPSANTKWQSDLEVAEAEGRICRNCKEAFICRNSLFTHLFYIHGYIECPGWWH